MSFWENLTALDVSTWKKQARNWDNQAKEDTNGTQHVDSLVLASLLLPKVRVNSPPKNGLVLNFGFLFANLPLKNTHIHLGMRRTCFSPFRTAHWMPDTLIVGS